MTPQPDRLQGVMFDVTERRLLAEQLMQAQKVEAIGQLAGGIAHDFNNLLTAITGYAELLLHRLGDNHRYARELTEILRAAERATRLTGKLLAFSRRQPLDPQNLDLNALLIDLDHLLRRLIGERFQLELSLASGPVMVRAEPTQLEQVVLNLVVNARDAMHEGGLVRIATLPRRVEAAGRSAVAGLRAGDYVELSVMDTGSGMDAETRRRLFEPFFTTKPVGQGTGPGSRDGLRHRSTVGWNDPGRQRTRARVRPSASSCRSRGRRPRRDPAGPERSRFPEGGSAFCWSRTIRRCGISPSRCSPTLATR